MGVLGCVAPPKMSASALAGRKMVSVENKLSVRPLFAAVVILSIFVAGSLFTGAPPVNAQAEEVISIEDISAIYAEDLYEYRLNKIETLLAEITVKIENMHSTYITDIKFKDELKIQSLELLREITVVSNEVELVSTDIKNIEEKMAKNSGILEKIWIGISVMILGAVLKEGWNFYISRKVPRVEAA